MTRPTTTPHAEAWELLPWLTTDRLAAAERDRHTAARQIRLSGPRARPGCARGTVRTARMVRGWRIAYSLDLGFFRVRLFLCYVS